MTEFLQLIINGLIVGSFYALVGLAIVLVYKATHIVSLAHGQLIAFGALFFWFTFAVLELPLWLSFLITAALAAAMGFMIDRFALRPLIGRPLMAAFLATFAIFMILDGIFQLILKGLFKVIPPFLPVIRFSIGDMTIPATGLSGFGISLVIFIGLAVFFRYTKLGLGMRATSEDHQLAQGTGISVKNIFSLVWIISAVAAAACGIILAATTDIGYSLPWIIVKGLVVALFGGLDSLSGALVAGLLLGVLESVGAGYLDPIVGGGLQDVAAYIMLLFILLVRPYGLFGQARIERV